MKINSINTLQYSSNKQLKKFCDNKQKVVYSYGVSSDVSNAVRNNALVNISFKGHNLNSSAAKKREMELIVEAYNVYSDVMRVFRNTAPDCAEEARELYKLASDDVQNTSNDKCLTLEQTICNGKIVPHKLRRNDRFGLPIYSADFLNGKISQINAFDMPGNVSKVIKYNEETGDVVSYQKNTDDIGFVYDFLIEYDSEYGVSELAKYSEKTKKDDNGNSNSEKVITFVDGESLFYKEDVVTTPFGEEIAAKRIFDFANLSTFDYSSSFSKTQGKETSQSEKIRIENNNMVSWT